MNFFERDETFAVIEQLTNEALARMLSSTPSDSLAPGLSQPDGGMQSSSSSPALGAVSGNAPAATVTAAQAAQAAKRQVSLRDGLVAQRRNDRFLSLFRLPPSETVSKKRALKAGVFESESSRSTSSFP